MTLQDFVQSASSLFSSGQKGLLAVSGGIDSSVLCHLMHRAQWPFAIAHCNFHLRPSDCDRDEAFVRQLAKDYGVECHVAQFDTRAYASQQGMSIEEAARIQRYQFFNQVREKHHYDYIATAHHRDDATETFFINLLRGTGLAGLRGIPARNGFVVRPLLPFGRAEIEVYARQHKLEHVEDSTNASTLFVRNKIRHQLLPLLRDINPSADTAIHRTIAHLSDAEQIYLEAIQQMRDRLWTPVEHCLRLRIADVAELNPQRTLLFELLRPYGFSSPQVDDILAQLHRGPGAQYFSPTHRLLRDRDCLVLSPLPSPAEPCSIMAELSEDSRPVSVRVLDGPATLLRDRHYAYFDADLVQPPLSLRRWRQGDRFRPFGMKGSMLVSDYFTDHKVSRLDKERVLLLVDAAGTILWLVGHRAAHIPVTSNTRRVLEVRWYEESH